MDRSITAAGLASGVMWSGALLAVGLINLAEPTYGRAFLKLARSVYPGTRARTGANVALLAAYGFADGFAAGMFFTMLYRAFGGVTQQHAKAPELAEPRPIAL